MDGVSGRDERVFECPPGGDRERIHRCGPFVEQPQRDHAIPGALVFAPRLLQLIGSPDRGVGGILAGDVVRPEPFLVGAVVVGGVRLGFGAACTVLVVGFRPGFGSGIDRPRPGSQERNRELEVQFAVDRLVFRRLLVCRADVDPGHSLSGERGSCVDHPENHAGELGDAQSGAVGRAAHGVHGHGHEHRPAVLEVLQRVQGLAKAVEEPALHGGRVREVAAALGDEGGPSSAIPRTVRTGRRMKMSQDPVGLGREPVRREPRRDRITQPDADRRLMRRAERVRVDCPNERIDRRDDGGPVVDRAGHDLSQCLQTLERQNFAAMDGRCPSGFQLRDQVSNRRCRN